MYLQLSCQKYKSINIHKILYNNLSVDQKNPAFPFTQNVETGIYPVFQK